MEVRPTERGFEFLAEESAVGALVSFIEYRTGGHCVIGRQPNEDGRVLLQVFTYLLPAADIQTLCREVTEHVWAVEGRTPRGP